MKEKLERYLNSLVTKNIITFVIILFFMVTPFVYFYLDDVEDLVSDTIAVQLEMVGELGEFLIAPEDLAKVDNIIWYETPEYERLVTALATIQKNFNVDNAVIYRRLPNKKFVYVADSKRAFGIGQPVALHDMFPGTYDAANVAWDTGKVGDTRLFKSGNSEWFQVNAPLKFEGKVAGVLLLNRFSTPIALAIDERQNSILLGVSLALAGGVFTWWFLTSRRMRPLIRLTNATKEIAEGNLHLEMPDIHTKSEIGLLHNSFRRMIADIQENRSKIEEHNRTLETRIEERTREISTLLDNMDEGLFSIDATGLIQPGQSRATKAMIGEVGGDVNFIDMLTEDEKARKLTKDTFEMLMTSAFPLDWNDMVENLPHEFQLESQPEPGRYLHAGFRPVHDAGGEKIERVLVILTDITREKSLQKDIDQNRALQNMVLQIIQNRESFELFYEDGLKMLEQSQESARGMDTAKRETVDELFRVMHTIKGTSGIFGLGAVSEAAHEIEDQLRDLGERRDEPLSEAERSSLVEEIDQLENLLLQQRESFLDMIGETDSEAEVTYPVTDRKVESIMKKVGDILPAGELAKIMPILETVKHIPTTRLARKYKNLITEQGRALGKKVEFAMEDPDQTEITSDFFKRIDPTLLHIFRNSLDHGMEESQEREAVGKTPMGTIKLKLRYQDNGLLAQVIDDGRGIDVEVIRKLAVEKGMVNLEAASKMTAEEVLEMLFEPRFSTKKTVTDLSGRGVGLDVVKTDVQQMGGKMKLTTQKGSGTTFELFFPLNQ